MPYQNCYCAFCRSPRKIYRKRSFSLFNIVQAVGTAGALSFALWQTIDARVMVVFIFALMMGEVVIMLKTRASVTCQHCGFDPVLYIKDQAKACARVQKHLEMRKDDVNVWLARKAPIRLPKRGKKSTLDISM